MRITLPEATAIAADLAEALACRAAGDVRGVLSTLDPLLRGPKADSYRAVYLMAAVASSTWTLEPGETFHRVKVRLVDEDGERDGSADDLPPAVRVFAQIAAAAANGDKEMCRDLFAGFCAERSSRAQALLLIGLDALGQQAARQMGEQS